MRPPALSFSFIRRLIPVVWALAAVALSGCERSPNGDVLTADLATYIENGYAPGLIEVTRAKRLDHDILPVLSRTRREVTFAAELRLRRDYDFGAWDQANAATLMHLLGTQAPAMEGLNAGGNKAGDNIHVTGHVIYRDVEGRWRLEGDIAPVPEIGTSVVSQTRLRLFAQWRRFSELTIRALFTPSEQLDEDLVESVMAASARLARRDGALTIASGVADSNYWHVAQAIANTEVPRGNEGERQAVPAVVAKPLINLATSGGRSNLRLLRSGAASAILLRGNEAILAAEGKGPFAPDGVFPELRALAGLFPEQVQVVVLAASPIASVADLIGKRLAVAAEGPTALIEAEDILRAHRVALSALAGPAEVLSPKAALAALIRGERDAVILTAPAPSPALRAFAAVNAVRLLPLEADAVALLTTGTSSYVAVTVPAQTYPSQGRPVSTVGVVTLLVSSSLVPADEVDAVLRAVFANVDFMRRGSPFSALLRAASAHRGLTLPLHAGAEAFHNLAAGEK